MTRSLPCAGFLLSDPAGGGQHRQPFDVVTSWARGSSTQQRRAMARLTTLRPRVQTLGAKPASPGGWAATSTKSTTERGYGWAWQKLRKQVLERDAGLCCVCSNAGRVTLATEVDHIINKAEGGSDEMHMLQSICAPCHKEKTARESARHRGY